MFLLSLYSRMNIWKIISSLKLRHGTNQTLERKKMWGRQSKQMSNMNHEFYFLTYLFVSAQVHKLDSSTWKNVTVVPIDIADRSQVAHAVSSFIHSMAPSCGQLWLLQFFVMRMFRKQVFYGSVYDLIWIYMCFPGREKNDI